MRQWDVHRGCGQDGDSGIEFEDLRMEGLGNGALRFERGTQPLFTGRGELGDQAWPHLFAPPAFGKVELAEVVEQSTPLGFNLATQGDELRAVAAQEALFLLGGRRFADDPAGGAIAVDGARGDQSGQGDRIAAVGLAPARERFGGEGQRLRTRLPDLSLEAPAEAARMPMAHRQPCATSTRSSSSTVSRESVPRLSGVARPTCTTRQAPAFSRSAPRHRMRADPEAVSSLVARSRCLLSAGKRHRIFSVLVWSWYFFIRMHFAPRPPFFTHQFGQDDALPILHPSNRLRGHGTCGRPPPPFRPPAGAAPPPPVAELGVVRRCSRYPVIEDSNISWVAGFWEGSSAFSGAPYIRRHLALFHRPRPFSFGHLHPLYSWPGTLDYSFTSSVSFVRSDRSSHSWQLCRTCN